jgi:acyl dehydratase
MLYFEDIALGETITSAPMTVDRDEMLDFARRWDPVPFHVDEEAGNAAFGGLTAAGVFVLAVKQRLVHQLPVAVAIIASLGYDEVRFHEPLRPGDAVHLEFEWAAKRESKSKQDRGVVTVRLSLVNQAGVTVMSHLDTVLVRRRS